MSICRVAVLGFGNVGSAVARRLASSDFAGRLELTHILDRHASERRSSLRSASAAQVAWTSSIDDVLTSDADVVVEAIGGVEPAADWIRRALLIGKSVVTANKQVIARHGLDLLRLASRQGRQLRFEAAVGGVMPIVGAIVDGLAGDQLRRIDAILNGTTHAVLSQIEATGCSMTDAIQDAQAKGYAERDPSLDLDGEDARAKLAILCTLAFGLRVEPSTIPVKSSALVTASNFTAARAEGCTIRQLAHAEYDRTTATLTAWVAPTRVETGSIFGRTTGPNNAAVVVGAHAGEIGIFGAGAGGDATAVAVVSDVLAIARDRAAVVPAPTTHSEFRIPNSDFLGSRTAEVVC